MDSIGTPEPERNDPVLEKQNILRDRQHQLADYKKNFQPLYPRKPYHWDTPDDKKMLFVGVMDDTNFPLARCRPVAVWVSSAEAMARSFFNLSEFYCSIILLTKPFE